MSVIYNKFVRAAKEGRFTIAKDEQGKIITVHYRSGFCGNDHVV